MDCSRQGFSNPAEEYKQARIELERGDLIKALNAATVATEKYQNRDPEWATRFRLLEAEVLIWQGKSKDVLSLLHGAPPQLNHLEDVDIRWKVFRGIADYRLQNFAESVTELSEAEQLAKSKRSDLLGEVAMAQGSLAALMGKYPDAIRSYNIALESARRQNRRFQETNALGNLGYVALRQQRFGEAIDWFSLAQSGASDLHNEVILEKTLGNLGWCYYKLGDYDRALENDRQAEAVSNRVAAVLDRLRWLNNIGVIHEQEHDYQRASAYYQESLELARSIGDRAASITALSNLALAALEIGDLHRAETYNEEAVRLQTEIGDATDFYPVLNSAQIALGRKQYPVALKLFREVISGAGNDESLRWEAESDLAALYAAEDKPVTAGLQYEKGLKTIDRARASLTKDEHRLSFLNTATRFYNDYIDFLVAHHREREALAVAEHSRARTLAEGLKIPVQLRESAFHPEENARRLNSVVLSYWLKPERSYLWVVTPTRVQLFSLPPQSEIDAAVDEYRKALLGPSQARDSAAGQKLYQMLVAPAEKQIGSRTRPCPTSVAVNRRGHHEPGSETTLGAPHLPSSGRCGSVPRVIIIADGSLVNLNFETLMVPAPEPHYWIEDATISNASSIALLRASVRDRALPLSRPAVGRDRVGRLNPDTMLLIGAPNYTGTEFPELSQARTEVDKVESYFPADARTVIEGKAAVPAAYGQAKPGEFTYIHFVAHGTASRLSPLDSSIVLSRQGDAYKLYARDIMQQPLKADLVTISACYGAGNRSYSGEGLVGLSWAFLRAGAHHVIAALWEVNDASTPQLMDNLYRNMNNGEDPATALRHAKLDMLHSNSVYRRPFYWGAFQIYVGS